MIATDSIKALANRYGITRAAIREIASDLGLEVAYDKARRTWIIVADATTVRAFNEHLAA